MKKIILIALAVLLSLGGMLLLSGCGGSEDNATTTTTAHVHVPAGTAYDATSHWTKCAGCDMQLDSEYHKFETVVIAEPTYREDGEEESHCKDCDYEVTGIVIPMLTHTCEWVIVDEEKTACGENFIYKCKLCDDQYTSFDKQQHNFVDYVCTRCDTKYASKGVTFSVDHTAKTVTVSGYVTEEVLVCGYDLPEGYSIIIGRIQGDFSSVVIPQYTTEIKTAAFAGCENLKELVIPTSVTKLGDLENFAPDLYGRNYIEKIVLHPDLTPCGEGVINCKNIYLDGDINDLVELMERGFQFRADNIYLKDHGSYALMVYVEYTGESLPDYAFRYVNCIREVKLTVDEIGKNCFDDCDGLTRVVLDAKTVGDSFNDCDALTEAYIDVNSIKGFNRCAQLRNLTLKAEMVENSFNDCDALTDVRIDANIIDGFNRCDLLRTVTLTNRSSYVSGFSGNPALEYFSSGSGEYIAFGGVFGECPALVRINIEKKSCSGLVVPASVKTLTVPDIAGVDFEDGGAEYGYKVPLVNLTVTDYCSDDFNDLSFSRADFAYLETLGISGSFDNIVYITGKSLKSVEIFSSKAFWLDVSDSPELSKITIRGAIDLNLENCPKLAELVVPEGVYGLSLYDNAALSELTLPKSLRSLGGSFTDALTKVYYGGSLLDWGTNVEFGTKNANPMQYAEDFYTRDGNTYIRPETLEGEFSYFGTINDYAFYGLKQLKTLGNVYPSIVGKYAFAESGLTEFSVGQNDIILWENAFENCTDLASFSINDPKYVGDYALKGCTSLKNLSINLPGGKPYISRNFLEGCDPITNSYEGGKYIGSSEYPYAILWKKGSGDAHPDCQYSYESGTYLMDSYAGYFYTVYEGIRYYGTVSNPYEIAELIMEGGKETYTFHPDTKKIGDGLFEDNSDITVIYLPEKLESIGVDAFKNCTSLERIRFNRNLTYIASGAFRGCEGLVYVDVQCRDAQDLFDIWFKIEFADPYSTPMKYASVWQGKTSTSNVPVNNIVIPIGTTTLKRYSLSGFNGQPYSVTIPATLTTVEDWALSDSTFDKVYYNGYLSGWMELNCPDFFNIVNENDKPVSKTRLFINGAELTSLVLDMSDDASVKLNSGIFSTASLVTVSVNRGYYINLTGINHYPWFWGAVNLKELYISGGTIDPYLNGRELDYLYLKNPGLVSVKGATIKKVCINGSPFLVPDLGEAYEIGELIIIGDTVHVASISRKVKKLTIEADNVFLESNSSQHYETLIINAKDFVVINLSTTLSELDTVEINCKYFISSRYTNFDDVDDVTINATVKLQR